MSGVGFLPGSPVTVWWSQGPTQLVELTVNADGTFAAPAGCPEWVAAVNSGGYRYLVISPPSADRDSSQIEVPVEVAWLQRAPNAERIVSERNTGVWRIEGKLSPDICSP